MNTELKQLDSALEVDPLNEELLIRRGRLHWSLSHRAQAMKDWLAAIKINPDSRARQLLQNANDILAYRNNNLYNP